MKKWEIVPAKEIDDNSGSAFNIWSTELGLNIWAPDCYHLYAFFKKKIGQGYVGSLSMCYRFFADKPLSLMKL